MFALPEGNLPAFQPRSRKAFFAQFKLQNAPICPGAGPNPLYLWGFDVPQ
jgi:hypothetical protein